MAVGLVAAGLGGILMGLGYTTGAYAGYGGWNTADPYGIHNKKGSPQTIRMAYGYYRRYRSYRRKQRYRRYRRYYYRRRYY